MSMNMVIVIILALGVALTAFLMYLQYFYYISFMYTFQDLFLIFSQRINSYPKDYTTKTEAIIVLTGGRNRIAEAVELFNKGLAKKMFISGVNKRISLNDIKDKQLLHINMTQQT